MTPERGKTGVQCSLCGYVSDTKGNPPKVPTKGGWWAHEECVQPASEGDFAPFEHHVMPSGAEVWFRSSDHAYFAGVKPDAAKGYTGVGRLTGVSTTVAPLDFRPDNLLKWAAHLNGRGVSILAADALSLEDADDMRSALAWLSSADSIWHTLSDARLLFSDFRESRATQGTNVHLHSLSALASGRPVPDRRMLTDEEWGYARGVMAFWHVMEPEPLQYEQVVVSHTHGVAGRFDLRCRIGPETWLIDCKTSGFIPAKHHGQLAGYDLLAIESGFGGADRLGVLQVDAQGGFELIDGQASHEDFLAALKVYRASGRINTAARRARKAAQQAVEAAA